MSFFTPHPHLSFEEACKKVSLNLGKEKLIDALKWMLLIRHFETRATAAYQHGFIGGFFHAYSGQEAIQTAVVQIFGKAHWYTATYRVHALALLLGASPEELMAELYGKETGNAKGRGGSMHLYTEHLLGGFAIVGGHLPIANGAAFSLKYQQQKEKFSICFLGEGAVAQGAFHESLNLASLWELPILFVIENNQWGMGTHVSRAICTQPIAEVQGKSYNIEAYTLNGMDYFNCYEGFSHIKNRMLQTGRPILVECICERFQGHSISDPQPYKSKEELKKQMQKDPLLSMRHFLENENILSESAFKALDKEQKEKILKAMDFAEKSPFPSPTTLEEDVYAP